MCGNETWTKTIVIYFLELELKIFWNYNGFK